MSITTTPPKLTLPSLPFAPAPAVQTSVIKNTFTPPPQPTETQGGGNGGSGNDNSSKNNSNSTTENSTALYLYTFLATLVLLLSVSGWIVTRAFILRRRHRRMVEEAIRNGTWVPPSASRAALVDLSKKPVLWEAYIDKNGSIFFSHGRTARGKRINLDWMMEQTKDWDMIKPISAAYLIPTLAGDPPPRPSSSTLPTPRHRAIFSRAMRMLNPTPMQTFPPGPANPSSSNINASGGETGDAHISMFGLDEKEQIPSLMTVAVLVAMPSPPTSSSSTSLSPARLLSASLSTNASSSSSLLPPPQINLTSSSSTLTLTSPPTKITQSYPLQINPAFPLSLPSAGKDEEEYRIPHIEVGIAEVLVVPPEFVAQDEGSLVKSIGSQDSVATEV